MVPNLLSNGSRLCIGSLVFVAGIVVPALWAQENDEELPSPAARIDKLQKEVEELREELDEIKKEREEEKKSKDDEEDESFFSGGVITLGGGAQLRLGARMELLFIDTERENDPGFEPTDEPDPHLELNRLRLYPEFRLNRHIDMRGQIDFKPERGQTRLKELTLRAEGEPAEGLEMRLKVGLDDRLMRPSRRTKGYPLAGNMFWRDETLGLWLTATVGSPELPEVKRPKRETVGIEGAGTEGFYDDTVDFGPAESGPFDFVANPGELRLTVSLTQGYVLDNNEVGFDNSGINDLVQDDRELGDDLSLRELGVGIRYRRDFASLGEVAVRGFYFDDELRNASVEFLQQELTLRDLGGNVLAGYGDSNLKGSRRYGVHGEYFLSAETYLGKKGVRRNDGPRVQAQWVEGADGRLRRDAWYVQGSYRYSFPERLLLDRYFRSIEPLVRYGEIDVNTDPDPALPGTWDREALTLGMFLEVTGEILIKAEYTVHTEDTGGAGSAREVDNDELMIELFVEI